MDLLPYLRFGVRGIQFAPRIPPGAVGSTRSDDLPEDRGLGSAGDKASEGDVGRLLGLNLDQGVWAWFEAFAGDNARRPLRNGGDPTRESATGHGTWDPGSACDPPERSGTD